MNQEQLKHAGSYDSWMDGEDMKDFKEVVGEVNWKGVKTDYMRWYDMVKEACGLQDLLGEEEDHTMEKFRVIAGLYFAVKKGQEEKLNEGNSPRDVRKAIIQRKGSLVKGSGHIADVTPQGEGATLTSLDQYGELTVNLLAARIRIEEVGSAYYRCVLFYMNIVQFCFAVVVFGVGALELDGGQFAPVLATCVAGCVAVIGSIYGILGSIGNNESFLRKYLVGGFWLLAILTTFLYTEVYVLNNEHIKCTPSKSSLSPDGDEGCDEAKTRHTTLILVALVQLVIVFAGAMNTINLLDGINDQTALETKQLLLIYMRTRMYELKNFMHRELNDLSTTRRMELLDDDLVRMNDE